MSEIPFTLPASGIATVDPRQLGRYLCQCILVVKSKVNRDQVVEFFYMVGMADNETLSEEVRQGIDALVIRVVNEPQNESEVKSAVEMMNGYLESLGNSDPRKKSSKIAEAWKKSKRLREGTEAKRMGEAILNQRRDETNPSEGLKEYHLRVDVRHEKKLDVTKYKICFTVPGRAQHGQVDNLVRYAATSGMVYQTVNSELRPINGKISIARRAVLYDRKSAWNWNHVERTIAIKDLKDTERLQLVNTTSDTFSIAAIQQTIEDPPMEPVLFGLRHPRKVSECLRKKNDPKYEALRSAIQLSIYNGTSNQLEDILKKNRFALILPSPPNSVLPSSYSPSSASQSHSSNLAETSPSLTSTEFGELIRQFPIPQFTGTLPSTFETMESNRISVYHIASEGSDSSSRTSSYHSLPETLNQQFVALPDPTTSNDAQEVVTGSYVTPPVANIPVPDRYPATRNPFPGRFPVPGLGAPDSSSATISRAPGFHSVTGQPATNPPPIIPVSGDHVPYSPSASSGRSSNSPVPSGRASGPHSRTSGSAPSRPSTPTGRAPGPTSNTNQRLPDSGLSSRDRNSPVTSSRAPDSHSRTSDSLQSHPSTTSYHTPYTPSAPSGRRSNSPVPNSLASSRHPGASDSASVPSRPATPRGRASDPTSSTSRNVSGSHPVTSNPIPTTLHITGRRTSGFPPVASLGALDSSSATISRRAPGFHSVTGQPAANPPPIPPVSGDHVPYPPSVSSDRRSNSPVPSGRASGPHSRTSGSAPSRPSTPTGRAPDPTSNKTQRPPDLVPSSRVRNSPVTSNRAPDSDSRTSDSLQSRPSITSYHTPYTPSASSGRRSNSPVPNDRVSHPETRDSASVPSRPATPRGRVPDPTSSTSRNVSGSHPVTSNLIPTTPPIAGRRTSGLPSVTGLRATDSSPLRNRRTPHPHSVQAAPVPDPRPLPAVSVLDLTPAQATLNLSSPSGPTFPTPPSVSVLDPTPAQATLNLGSPLVPTFPTPLSADPALVAETSVNTLAPLDEDGPAGFVNNVSSRSHPVPSPSNSVVSSPSNAPAPSASTAKDARASVARNRETLESPSTTSLDSQNTNQSATAAQPKKKEGFFKKLKRFVGMS